MVNYIEAIKRPFTDFKKLIIGVLLGIIPVVNLLVLGYILECAKSANKKKYELPKWKNFGELWVEGFFVFLISVIYSIPLIIYGIWTMIYVVSMGAVLSSISIATPYVLGIIVLAIITFYIIPSAILNFAFTKKLGSAFKLKKVFKKAFNKKYLNAWTIGVLLYIAVLLVFGGIAQLGNMKIAAFIADAIIGFVGGIVFYTILGEQW